MPSKQSMLIDRTPAEIVARIRHLKGTGPLTTETSNLLIYLDYEDAQPFLAMLRNDVAKAEWESRGLDTPANNIRHNARDMWATANNRDPKGCKNNIMRLRAWLWLDLNEAVFEDPKSVSHTAAYGKVLLHKTATRYDLNWRRMDDNRWYVMGNDKYIAADEALKKIYGEHIPS